MLLCLLGVLVVFAVFDLQLICWEAFFCWLVVGFVYCGYLFELATLEDCLLCAFVGCLPRFYLCHLLVLFGFLLLLALLL